MTLERINDVSKAVAYVSTYTHTPTKLPINRWDSTQTETIAPVSYILIEKENILKIKRIQSSNYNDRCLANAVYLKWPHPTSYWFGGLHEL